MNQMTNAMPSVAVKDLHLAYGSVNVLNKLNLDIAEGEFIVLLGPSGCGKSTLLNCIAGLLDITDGQIWIKGKNVTWEEPKDRGIGMVFQSYALYPQMTRARQPVVRPEERRPAQGRDRQAHQARLRDPADRAAARPQARRPLRRPAPARRDRPGAGARRRRLPLRRAALEPRRQAPLRAPRRDQAAAPAAREHDDLRHPRPDRGADPRRPHRGDARRHHPAARRPQDHLQQARRTSSSPASSARRR